MSALYAYNIDFLCLTVYHVSMNFILKNFIAVIILIVYIFASDAYALEASFNGLIENKTQIPTDIVIKKKNGKSGVVNKKTGELLIPFEYKSISRLGIDTLMLCKDKNNCIISTNNNSLLFKDFLDKKSIVAKKINKNLDMDIENSIFSGC